ncbi:MAG TPA: zinc-ribbon domain-containing protein [Polyangiaceae bacterium]|jgi:hypothetical protein|nr:zinc-ribbon domain-containing protein [Polyangiaceae bacterium]
MTERRRKPSGKAPDAAAAVPRTEDGDEAERFLGRIVAMGLPIVCVVAAIAVGFVASVGSALLVLASGALLGTIALLWASVRTLSGDAPLPADLEALAAQHRDVDALAEQKRRVLRALKDLEAERALGKIDEADYEAIAMKYRDEAKALMREMDRNAAPALAEAERIAREYLAAQGLGPAGAGSPAAAVVGPRGRLVCPNCATSNEPDAAFCKKCGTSMAKTAEERDATS